MMRSLFHSSSLHLQENLTRFQIEAALRDESGTLWVDFLVENGKRDEIAALLREVFRFHALAIADALHESHIPRIDDWEDHLYINWHALILDDAGELALQEVDIFLGRNYLITLHEKPLPVLDQLWNQCAQGVERRLTMGPDHVLYTLTDQLTVAYMKVVDGLDDAIDNLEHEIFDEPTPGTVNRIFRVRRTLLRLRRILGAMREVMNRLARDDYAVVDARDKVYFRDVYDHLVRLYDIIEGLRDMAAGALDSYLSVSSARINEIMRTLTVVTVLFMPISFIASFFGMNFFGETFNIDNPMSSWLLFGLCLTITFGLPPAMLWWMARKGWLRSITKRRGDDSDRPGPNLPINGGTP
jgi:magnesium transporter